MKKRLLLYFTLFLTISSVFAKQEVEAFFVKKSTTLEINVIDDHLKITEHHVSEKKFIENFEKNSQGSVYYSDFDLVTNLTATTLLPNKSFIKKNQVSFIETEDIFQPGIFYGGYKRVNFVFPMLAQNAIGRLEYSKRISDPHLLNPFYFDEAIPVTSSEFSVVFPENVILQYKLFGQGIDRISMTEKKSHNKVTYTWTLKDLPGYNLETGAPSRPYSAPHIILHIESFETKNGKVKVLSDISDLYDWYQQQVQQIPKNDDTPLRQQVNTVIHNKDNEMEKVKAIFQWVQSNIKYIAFENGMAGFIPRSSTDVYNKRYGDCKDMANLLKDMLTMAGIEAHLTWIGTRSKPYSYKDVPTTIANDHMICTIKLAEKGYVFLDATNPFLAFGSPSSMIQNKEALIGIGAGHYEVVKIPIVNGSQNRRDDTLKIQLKMDGIHGKFSSTLTGFRKDDIEIKHLKAQIKNDKEYIRDFFAIGSNNINISNLSIKGLGDQNESAKASFDFSLQGYVKNIGDKIYINMHFNRSIQGDRIDLNHRHQMLEQDYCYEDHSVTELEIPEGYSISFIPRDIEKKGEKFGITLQYSKVNNTIIMKKTIYSNYLYLGSSDFIEWNDFLETVSTIHQQSVTLAKNNK